MGFGLCGEKTEKWVIITYCICCAGSLAMLVISFTWMCIARYNHSLMVETYSSLVSNWDNEMVFDLTGDANYALPSSNYYLKPWSGLWPGTIEGCFCSVTNSQRKVYYGLKQRACNSNETRTGCEGIPATPKKDLDKWTGGQIIYAVRGKGTSFKDTYQKINIDGTCASGYKHCGNSNSIGKGLCIPDSFTKCPLTDISLEAKFGYSSVPLSGFTLYTNTDNKANPISDLMVREDHLCFVRGHMPKTPNRGAYRLYIGDYESCQNDPIAWSLGEIGEKTYLDLNGVDYSKLTTIVIDDKYIYKLFAGRYLEWSASCADTVPSISKKQEDLNYIKTQFLILLILYSIVLALTVLYYLFQFVSTINDNKILYKILYLVRILVFVLVAPSLIIVTIKTGGFVVFFKNVIELNCSTKETNELFKEIYTRYDDSVYGRVKVMIALAFCNVFADSFLAFLFLRGYETLGEWLNRVKSPSERRHQAVYRYNGYFQKRIDEDRKKNQVTPATVTPGVVNSPLVQPSIASNLHDSSLKLTAKPISDNSKEEKTPLSNKQPIIETQPSSPNLSNWKIGISPAQKPLPNPGYQATSIPSIPTVPDPTNQNAEEKTSDCNINEI